MTNFWPLLNQFWTKFEPASKTVNLSKIDRNLLLPILDQILDQLLHWIHSMNSVVSELYFLLNIQKPNLNFYIFSEQRHLPIHSKKFNKNHHFKFQLLSLMQCYLIKFQENLIESFLAQSWMNCPWNSSKPKTEYHSSLMNSSPIDSSRVSGPQDRRTACSAFGRGIEPTAPRVWTSPCRKGWGNRGHPVRSQKTCFPIPYEWISREESSRIRQQNCAQNTWMFIFFSAAHIPNKNLNLTPFFSFEVRRVLMSIYVRKLLLSLMSNNYRLLAIELDLERSITRLVHTSKKIWKVRIVSFCSSA